MADLVGITLCPKLKKIDLPDYQVHTFTESKKIVSADYQYFMR